MQIVAVVRDIVRHMMSALAQWLNKLTNNRLKPNVVTIAGFLGHLLVAWLIAARHPWRAAVLLVIFGLFDTLDGELARLQHRESALGRLLDSVSDRIKEVLLYSASGYFIIATTDRPFLAIWAVAACGTALLVSYLNAWGEVVLAGKTEHHVVNRTLRVGLASFEIRMFILLVGLLSGRMALAMIVITVLASITIVQRFMRIAEKLRV